MTWLKHAQENAAVAAVPGADTLAVDAIAGYLAGHGYGEYYDTAPGMEWDGSFTSFPF